MTSLTPLTILVQGGIASGKSTLAKLIAEQGGTFVDCDRLGHEVLEEEEVRAALRAAFGESVFGADGRIDRSALGRIVFSDADALARLEAVVHPRITARVQEAIDAARTETSPRNVVVIDAAVAEKMHLAAMVDLNVFVEVDLETRRARAAQRGWEPGELERREARQKGLSEKRSEADLVIDNSGDLAEAEQHVKRFWTDVVDPRR